MRLICEKLELKKGQRVLDIGGGWGGLARFMRERYEVSPTVVTLSQEQGEHIKKTTNGIEVLIADYRDIPKSDLGFFDAVSIVGFIEHVGHKNYQTAMKIVRDSLKQEGKFLLHTLYTPYSSPRSDAWLNKHIFPNGELSPTDLLESTAREYFIQYQNQHPHFQELTPNYYKTLLAWDENLTRAITEGNVNIPKSERRKWHYYFRSCAGAIKAGHMRVGQFLYQRK